MRVFAFIDGLDRLRILEEGIVCSWRWHVMQFDGERETAAPALLLFSSQRRSRDQRFGLTTRLMPSFSQRTLKLMISPTRAPLSRR